MSNFKFQISNFKFLAGLYLLGIIALFFYSYTQVDLSLTLSRVSIYQTVEKAFQYVGYFQRPLSAYIFIAIIVALFFCYIAILHNVHLQKFKRKQVWILILLTAGILTFAYNAFSYDLFNYIFDAKIFTHYHLNPYLYMPLNFSKDPMLSFMHWTHRAYPYGPAWLFLTIPFSFIGLQIFLPTFFLFKILISASFLGTAYFLEKILQKKDSNNALFGLAFFAFNPLVIIEALVSSHIDMVMLFFFMLSLFFYYQRKYVFWILSFLFSIAIKFATGFALPVFVVQLILGKKKLNFDKEIILFSILMIFAIVAQSVRTNFQPWYLLDVLPIVALISKKYYVLIPSIIISFFALLQYVYFLYNGNFNPPFPQISFWLSAGSVIVSLGILGVYKLQKK